MYLCNYESVVKICLMGFVKFVIADEIYIMEKIENREVSLL